MEYINSLCQNSQEGDGFKYALLARLQQDCEYYLGNNGNNRSVKHLWAGNVEEQIASMRALHNSFPSDAKPEWLSAGQIDDYAQRMA